MNLSLNPVLAREVRERFRGRRAPIFVTLWVLGVGLIGYLVYIIAQYTARDAFGLGQAVAGGYMGRFIYEGMLFLLMTGVVMIVPGLTSLSIVGERERQTFHLLQVTQLSPLQIVLGKLWSSMSYFVLLLVSVAPVVAVPLLFGGVRITDLLAGLGMVILTALMLGSVGIWASSRARSSRGAVASAYTWSFVLAFITLAAMAGELLIFSDGLAFPPNGREIVSILPNPYVGMVSAVVDPLGSDGLSGTPFDIVEVLLLQRQGFEAFGFGMDLGPDMARALPLRRPPVWMFTVGIYVLIIFVALVGATRRVTAPASRIRPLRRANGS
ncbi:MAG TPA: ABC transporter permease subunit [Acidimicrobiia bacterium]